MRVFVGMDAIHEFIHAPFQWKAQLGSAKLGNFPLIFPGAKG